MPVTIGGQTYTDDDLKGWYSGTGGDASKIAADAAKGGATADQIAEAVRIGSGGAINNSGSVVKDYVKQYMPDYSWDSSGGLLAQAASTPTQTTSTTTGGTTTGATTGTTSAATTPPTKTKITYADVVSGKSSANDYWSQIVADNNGDVNKAGAQWAADASAAGVDRGGLLSQVQQVNKDYRQGDLNKFLTDNKLDGTYGSYMAKTNTDLAGSNTNLGAGYGKFKSVNNISDTDWQAIMKSDNPLVQANLPAINLYYLDKTHDQAKWDAIDPTIRKYLTELPRHKPGTVMVGDDVGVGSTPVTRQINQATDTVSGQITNLLSADSPYMQQGKTFGLQQANDRGLLNSSMAVGAAQGAMIERALPIAQQDASTYFQQGRDNQGYQNQFNMANFNNQLQQKLMNLDADLKDRLAGNDSGRTMKLELAKNNAAIWAQFIQASGEINKSDMSVDDKAKQINALQKWAMDAINQNYVNFGGDPATAGVINDINKGSLDTDTLAGIQKRLDDIADNQKKQSTNGNYQGAP